MGGPATAPRRTVLVTGTSSGIGLNTAVAAARSGWHVVATMRDPGRSGPLEEAAAAAEVADHVEVRRLDVTDPDSVTACVDAVVADRGELHALVNNAGAGHVGTLEVDGVDAARRVMEVNYFGVLTVTAAALSHLRAARGRLIAVTSVGGVVGQPFNEAYCAAKFALEGHLEAFAPLAAEVGVAVTMIEPAAVASSFVAHAGVPDDSAASEERMGPYAPALRRYLERTAGAFDRAQPAADAAAAVVAVLDAERPPVRVQTSDAARAFVAPKLADPDGSRVVDMTRTWLT